MTEQLNNSSGLKQRVMKVCTLLPRVGRSDWQWEAPCSKTRPCRSGKAAAAAAARSLQSCPTLCNPIDGSPPSSPSLGFSRQEHCGVGCHFLLQCMKVKSESEVAQSCPTLSDPMDCSPPDSFHPWDFPGKSTGVGCHCLLWKKLYQSAKIR